MQHKYHKKKHKKILKNPIIVQDEKMIFSV